MGHDGGRIQDRGLFESTGRSRLALGSFVATQQGSRHGTMVLAGRGLLEQRGRQLVRGRSSPGKTQHQAGSLPDTELSCRDLFKRRKKTDTQFAEQRRGDVESHLTGLGTPKGIACSTKIGPAGGGHGVRHG